MQGTSVARHTITHRAAPTRWRHGFPLGNGTLGAMFWGDKSPLCLTLDRADLWDLRHNDAYERDPDFTYARLLRLVAVRWPGRLADTSAAPDTAGRSPMHRTPLRAVR